MTKSQVKPIPAGMHTLTPHLICDGAAKAIDFYVKAFGAVEIMRMPRPDGKLMHAQVRIGDSPLMLLDEFPEMGCIAPKGPNGVPITLHLYVEDVDSFFARAVAAGATAKMQPTDMFWGDRYAQVADPFGYVWSIATHVRDLTPEEMLEGMKNMQEGCGGQ